MMAPFTNIIAGHLSTATVYTPGSGVTYSATTDQGGSATFPNTSAGVLQYVPKSDFSGIETIEIRAKMGQAESDKLPYGALVKANTAPSVYQNANTSGFDLPIGTSTISLPIVDADGDTVTWSTEGTKQGTFVQLSGANFSIANNQLTVLVPVGTPAGEYTITSGIKSVESGNGIPASNTIPNTSHQVKIRVGMGNPPDASINTVINNRQACYRGVPLIIQFDASSSQPGDTPLSWGTNDGVNKTSVGKPKGSIWVSTFNAQTPDPVNDSVVYQAMQRIVAQDNTQTMVRPTGELWYISDASIADAQILAGVYCDYASGARAYRNFYVDINGNEKPWLIDDGTDYAMSPTDQATVIYGTTNLNVDKTWSVVNSAWPETTPRPTNSTLVLKGSRADAKDLDWTFDFSNIRIGDNEFGQKGDKAKVTLTGIYKSTITAANNILSQFTGVSTNPIPIDIPVTYAVDNNNNTYARLTNALKFRVPVGGSSATIATDTNLYFTFDVEDFGGNKVTFNAMVPAQVNDGPVIDGGKAAVNPKYPSHGDALIGDGGWVKMQPLGGEYTAWKLVHGGVPVGDETDAFKVTDRLNAKAYLAVMNNVEETTPGFNNVVLTPTTLVQPGNAWEINWNPSLLAERKNYQYTIKAWNEFGASSDLFTMQGVVWGKVTGTPVTKSFYLYDKVLTLPADFNTFASIELNPYFDKNQPKSTNEYGWDSKVNLFNYGTGNEGDASWKVIAVPQGYYLVSAGKLDTLKQAVTAPVVGPALLPSVITNPTSDTQVSGRFAYAYINPNSPDLSAYTGLGALTAVVDKSFSLDVNGNNNPGYWLADNLVNLQNALNSGGYPLDWQPFLVTNDLVGTDGLGASTGWGTLGDETDGLGTYSGNLSALETGSYFKGSLTGVGVGDLRDSGAIQFVFKRATQKAFFETGEGAVSATPYPTTSYPATLGWTGVLGYAEPNAVVSDGEYSFNEIKFKLDDVFSFQVPSGDQLYLATMEKKTVNTTANFGYNTANDVNYWRVARSSVTTVPELGGAATTHGAGGYTAGSNAIFTRANNGVALGAAKVMRSTFSEYLPMITGSAAVAPANVKDTLQVLSYPAGTSLGPVENLYGVPTLLEFGELNRIASTVFGTRNATTNALTTDTVDLTNGGTDPITIPVPDSGAWYGDSSPVVHYIANYASNNIPGSMGVITTNVTDALTFDMAPITNVTITTKEFNETLDATPTYVRTLAQASSPITATVRTGTASLTTPPFYDYYNTPVVAKIFREPKNLSAANVSQSASDYGQVWLTWTNPNLGANSDKWSGTIIEFYNATGAGSTTPPAYQVFIDKTQTQFPIPQTWVEDMVANYGGGTNIVIKFRAVKYGDNATLIDFNQSPFKKALPASWIDTITTPVDFSQITYPLHNTPVWSQNNYTPTVNGNLTAAIDPTDNGQATLTTGTFNFTFAGTTYSSTNPPPGGFTYSWGSTATALTGNAQGGSRDAGDVTVTGGNTLTPTITIANASGYWDGLDLTTAAGLTLKLNVTATDPSDGVTTYTSEVPVQVNLTQAVYDWDATTTINLISTHNGALASFGTSITPSPAFTQFTVTGSNITSSNWDKASLGMVAAWDVSSATPLPTYGNNAGTPGSPSVGTDAVITVSTVNSGNTINLPTVTLDNATNAGIWDGLDSLVINGMKLTLTKGGTPQTVTVPVTIIPVWTTSTAVALKDSSDANITLTTGTGSAGTAGTVTLAGSGTPAKFTATGSTVTEKNTVTYSWDVSNFVDTDSGVTGVTLTNAATINFPDVAFAGTGTAGTFTFDLNCNVTFNNVTAKQTFAVTVTLS